MPAHQKQPTITASRGVVASGHYLATTAGFKIMQNGGNAIDTAAATALCLNLVMIQGTATQFCHAIMPKT